MASSDLIQDEPIHDAEPPPAKKKPASGTAKKKASSKPELPPLPEREDEDEYREFLAAKRAKAEANETQAKFLELDGKQYEIATIDENVMGHIQTVMMFGADADNQLGRIREILDAMLVPGEYERLAKDTLAYVKRLRKEHYEYDGEGDPPPSITDILLIVLEGITEDLTELRSDPKA